MKDNQVGRFFDSLTTQYTETIERCFPRYQEMLWALLDYLPQHPINSVLELGCGTGNLSVLLSESLPQAKLHCVDLSGESLDECRSRLPDGVATFEQQDFRHLRYVDESFDLVVASISIHHLIAEEKRSLFKQCHRWLRDGGIFSFADQCAGASSDLHQRHIQNWKDLSFGAGASSAEWEMWMDHQREHDHHDTLVDQVDWIRDAGFPVVDCTWRYLLWSVIQARK